MRITVNDEVRDVRPGTLAAILDELGYGGARVATALDGTFVPAGSRASRDVGENAVLEVLAPMQGG